jgi:enoyl-CoA hydratase/carnithine racemase
MMKLILKEERTGVCRLTLNRPEKRNALSCEMMMMLGDAVSEAASSGKSRVLILRGSDGRAFCAGGDLTESMSGDFGRFVKAIQYLQQSLINYPFPAIAAIQGAAIGLGLDLATLCDIRLAGQNAYFSANTVRLGKVYHDTQARRLIRIVGWGAATEMLLTGHTINAIQAEKIGLATRLYPNDLLDEKAFELAAEIIEEAVSEAVRDTKFMLRSLAQNGDRP